MIRCATCSCAVSEGHVYTVYALNYHRACIPLETLIRRLQVFKQPQNGRIKE